MKKCKICGKNAQSDYCFVHKLRTPIKKTKIRLGVGSYKQAKIRDNYNAQCDMFTKLWETMSIPRMSQVSGTYLGSMFSTIFFHHILPKSKYPEAMLDVENIVILSGDEHANVENDMYKYEEINSRREKLRKKYSL